MNDVPAELLSPRDDDDDDVAWALQTAQVQWQRGAYADAVTWLRRAADSALRIGATGRAWDLKLAASKLAARIPAAPVVPSAPPPAAAPFPPSAPPPASVPFPPSSRPPQSVPFPPSSRPPAATPSSPPGPISFPPSTRTSVPAPFPPSGSAPSSAPFPPSSRPPTAPRPSAPPPPGSLPPLAAPNLAAPPSSGQAVDDLLGYGPEPADADLYDDGTDIIDMPPVEPRRATSRPPSTAPVSIDEVEEIEPEAEELEPELMEDDDVEELDAADAEIEEEPESLLSEIDADEPDYEDDPDIEEERQSLLSDELEPYAPAAPEVDRGAPVSTPPARVEREAALAALEKGAHAGVDVEPDESEDEPTHKLRVDAVARRKSAAPNSLADELAPSLGNKRPSAGAGLRPSLADELEPDDGVVGPSLTELAKAVAPAEARRRSQRPRGSIDWDDNDAAEQPVPSTRASKKPQESGAHRAPASISPRATGIRASRAPSAEKSPASAKATRSRAPGTNEPAKAARSRASNKKTAKSTGDKARVTARRESDSRKKVSRASASRAPSESASKSRAAAVGGRASPKNQERAESTTSEDLTLPILGGVSLEEVRGLEDLPEDAQIALAKGAHLETLNTEEELNGFAVALVLRGKVAIMPAIADAACAVASVGEVVFTEGHLADGVTLRVVASIDDTQVAFWTADEFRQQIANCPWVDDDLRSIADRFQALAGAAMGSLGDRLDETLRAMVTDRCEVMHLAPEETLIEAGQTVNGMYVVGAGHVELVVDGKVTQKLHPGDFLFPAQVMAGGGAPSTARASKEGALLLRAERMTAHELLVSVPPLLEILAG